MRVGGLERDEPIGLREKALRCGLIEGLFWFRPIKSIDNQAREGSLDEDSNDFEPGENFGGA
jgi:hypothetical protein